MLILRMVHIHHTVLSQRFKLPILRTVPQKTNDQVDIPKTYHVPIPQYNILLYLYKGPRALPQVPDEVLQTIRLELNHKMLSAKLILLTF